MAIPVNIEELINQRIVESSRIEYKEGFNPEPIIKTICAFANDIDNIGGGYIIIGIKEKDGKPVIPVKGIDPNSVDGILKKLREYCHYIEPLYEPVIEPIIYKNKQLIVIWVAGGYGRPYKAPKSIEKNQSNKYYFIRKFSSTVIASRDEEKELFYLSTDIPYDDRPNLLANIDDLDIELIRKHLKEIDSSLYEKSKNKSLESLATDLKIVGGLKEDLRPLNVGILMFSENVNNYFRYARIEVVDIPDPTGRNMSEKVFDGTIQTQLVNALQYIKNYIIKKEIIKTRNKIESKTIYNYPFIAIKEILSNAVYHRSYQIQEPITVRITKNEMEITSFPGFDRSITEEMLKTGEIKSRMYRNRRIGDFLKELKLVEERNTGFPNAYQALKENGSPNLRFEMDAERKYLSVIIPIHDHYKTNNKSDDYNKKIINILKNQPLTLTELSRELRYKGISKKLKTTIENLKEEKIIEEVVINKSIKLKVK